MDAVRGCADERALAVREPSEWEQQERGPSLERYFSLTGRAGELRFHIFAREERGGSGFGGVQVSMEGETLRASERRALWKSLETALRQVAMRVDLNPDDLQHIVNTLKAGGEDAYAEELLVEHEPSGDR